MKRARSLWLCLAVVICTAAAELSGPSFTRFVHAEDEAPSAEKIELPLIYEGQGLRVVVKKLDLATGRLSGDLVMGKLRWPYVAAIKTLPDGDEVIVGNVTTKDGSREVRMVEESDTVALVAYGGKTYRVVKVKNVPAAKTPKKDEPVPPPLTARPRPTGRVVLTQHTLIDKGSADMKSHTILAPKGWKVEGGAWWAGANYFKILPSQDIKVTAPDGHMVHIGPSISATDYQPSEYAVRQLGSKRTAEGTASDGYPVIYMPANLEAWKPFLKEKGIRATYPKATDISVDSVVVVPELTQLLQRQLAPLKKQNAEANRQSQAVGGGTFSFTDGAVLGASGRYTLGGKKWELLMVFGVTHSGLDTQVGRQIWWGIEPNVAFRAPAGQLEASLPLLMSISSSLRVTPQWLKMKTDHMIKMNQIAAKGAADRARIIADSNREINRIITEGHRKREAIRDATHRKVINTIRGVDDYTTAGSSTSVQLPSDYEHVYTNGNGEYVLTNDANYNPNQDPTMNSSSWKTMEAVK